MTTSVDVTSLIRFFNDHTHTYAPNIMHIAKEIEAKHEPHQTTTPRSPHATDFPEDPSSSQSSRKAPKRITIDERVMVIRGMVCDEHTSLPKPVKLSQLDELSAALSVAACTDVNHDGSLRTVHNIRTVNDASDMDDVSLDVPYPSSMGNMHSNPMMDTGT